MKAHGAPMTMILLAAGAALAPHVPRLPAWIVIWSLAGWSWSLLVEKQRLPRPGKGLLNLLAAAGFIGCLATFGLGFNRSAGVAVLVVMVGLKILEAHSQRDRMVTAFLLYFLTLAGLLSDDGVFMLPYMICSVLLTTAAMIRIQDPAAPAVEQIQAAGRIVLAAIPVMAALFILFPRVPGGFWRVPAPNAAQTGFSEVLSPGSVSQLVASREIAFRATVAGEPVPAEDRYWRGLVFAEFDGRSWHPRRPPALAAPTAESGGGTVSQQIDLEPHHSRRLFALDRPVAVSVPATIFADHTVQTPDNIDERLRYSAVSTTALAADPLQPWEQRVFLALPPDDNPEARKLAAGWRAKARQPSEIIETALSYLRSRGFVYSVTPPLLGEHPVDDFLLGSRKGFCEHYASAFAFLMRAAGVPSRVVAGYLGGEQNPFGGYLIVRQSDAHAWVEVWLEGRGWTRIDPTSVVAPERAEGGAEAALPPNERIARPPFSHLPVIGEAARRIVLGWDAVNTFWDRRVLGYTADTQRRLLARLGISGLSRRWTAAVFAAGLLLATAVLVAAVLRPAPVRRRSDPVQSAYLKLCTRLARLGLPRRPDQGPLDYLKTIEQKRPELRPALGPVFEAYIHFRYGGRCSDSDRSRFLKSVRRLSLKKRPGGAKK